MPKYPKTDHCDGSRFFNLLNPKGNGFREIAKMLFTLKYQDWPKYVQNSPALDLNHGLSKDEAGLTFVNHATVLVQTKDFNLLTDPVWSERVSPVGFAGPKRHRDPGIPFDQLPKIDFVVVSHNHYDHLDLSTLKKLNETFHPHFIVPLGNKVFLESNGITNVTELDWWQTLEATTNLRVTLTPAEHFSGRSPFDRDETLWGSYVLTFNGHTLYFAGDTAYAPHFEEVRKRFGPPDIALLPIGAYDPRWFMKIVHMNPEEAVQAHLDLGAKQSIGIHFGTFQLTEEKIDQPVKDLEIALKDKKVPAKDFVTLQEGRTQIFDLKK